MVEEIIECAVCAVLYAVQTLLLVLLERIMHTGWAQRHY